MIVLRPYQETAKATVYEHLRTRDDNPCVVIPTGAGKTPVLAMICKDAVERWNGRVIVLAHVKELLEQSADKLRTVAPELDFGLYSAGLRRRDTDHAVVVAGIQSVYHRACELDRFDLVIVDEAHLIPRSGEGRYQQFLAEARTVNPRVRVIGFTATPFRLDSGPICAPDHFLNAICYEIGVRELIRDGYLCPLVTKSGATAVDTSRLRVRGGKFVAGELEALMDTDGLVESACAETVERTADRYSTLIFAAGVAHAQHVRTVLKDQLGVECGLVCGRTPPGERDRLLHRFRAGELKCLVNVNVLTTGFDAPNVDCVVMLRPTLSPGLYYQMVGRGFRTHPGKRDCLVLDFGGNVLRHGPVDELRMSHRCGVAGGEAPAKECPECRALIATGYARCPQCGHAFPPPERRTHEAKATTAGILSKQFTDEEYPVRDVAYGVHAKRDAAPNAPRTMRVDYVIGLNRRQSEFVCFEHTGYARHKAIVWWNARSREAVPETAEEAVEMADAGGLALTESITVRTVAGEKYSRIVGYRLGPIPEPLEVQHAAELAEVPF